MLLNKRVPFRYVLNTIKKDMTIVLLVGLAAHYLSLAFREHIPDMPLSIPAFLGTAISILLSFKMNQSYDRWWEARKIWGAIVNDSRTLVIQLLTLVNNGDDGKIERMAHRQIAWCYLLGESLRGLSPGQNVKKILTESEFEKISSHMNKPLAVTQLNAKELKSLRSAEKLDTFSHLQIDRTLVRLVESMGKAERINGTVFPSTYRNFLHFIIYIFVVTLSISLRDVGVIYEIPLLLLISSGFFLIEKSAYHLQDPFRNRPSDTSVTAIARTIEINIRQLLGEKEIPEPLRPEGYYIM